MQVRLQAKIRTETGKGAARKARRDGRLPAVLYGTGVDPTPVSVDRKDFQKALSTEAGRNVLIELELEGRKKPILALAREIQKDPVRNEYLHLDFLAIRHDTKIHAEVPVILEGKAPASTKGLVIETHLTSLSVECLPADVPAHLEAPAEILEDAGDLIKAKDIPLPEGVTLLADPEEVVASLALPPAVAAAEAEEVEVAVAEAEAEAAPASEAGESAAPPSPEEQ